MQSAQFISQCLIQMQLVKMIKSLWNQSFKAPALTSASGCCKRWQRLHSFSALANSPPMFSTQKTLTTSDVLSFGSLNCVQTLCPSIWKLRYFGLDQIDELWVNLLTQHSLYLYSIVVDFETMQVRNKFQSNDLSWRGWLLKAFRFMSTGRFLWKFLNKVRQRCCGITIKI